MTERNSLRYAANNAERLRATQSLLDEKRRRKGAPASEEPILALERELNGVQLSRVGPKKEP